MIQKNSNYWHNCLLMMLGLHSVLCFALSAQSVEWTQSTPLPEPRAGYAAGVVNDKLVIAGGTYWEGSKGNWIKKHFTRSTHAFDASTQRWDKLPDAPIPLGYGASAVANGKLFLLGGYDGTSVSRKIFTLEFKQGRYAWSTFGDMPADRLFAKALGIGNAIYLLGGVTQFEPIDPAGSCCTSKTATKSLMVLDTTKPEKGWHQLPPYPGAARWGFSAATDGSSIWMLGGSFQGSVTDPLTKFREVLRYRIAGSKWEASGPLPESIGGASGTPLILKNRVLLIGAKEAWQLDLTKMEYSRLSSLPEVAFVDTFVWLDNKIIGAGGENTIEGPRRRSEWTFTGEWVEKVAVSER